MSEDLGELYREGLQVLDDLIQDALGKEIDPETTPEIQAGVELLKCFASFGLQPTALLPVLSQERAMNTLLRLLNIYDYEELPELDVADWTYDKEAKVLAALVCNYGLLGQWVDQGGVVLDSEKLAEAQHDVAERLHNLLVLRDSLAETETESGVGNGRTFWRKTILAYYWMLFEASNCE